ncbi:MAG TPA: periplasmic heavy metal sensor [Thermoanaerobaculia bacterium]|nr:periplasmic heavy metal sensor [Thermoanaerobaculia bacterium]
MKPRTRHAALTALLIAGATLTAVAAPPRPVQGPGQGQGQGPAAAEARGPHGGHLLRLAAHYLQLTDEQTTAARQIFEDARTAAQPLIEQLRTSRQQLRDLLDQANPDAAAVGQAVIAADATREQLRALREDATADFRALLTTEQQARLDAFLAALHALRDRRGGPGEGDGGEG